MENYKITYIGDNSINNVHHIGIEYDGYYYSVIFGQYINGGFCSIPNWSAGCELSSFEDVFWNTESIQETLKKKEAAQVIARAIAEYSQRIVKRK